MLIPDPENGIWYAKIPTLVGCMADGTTPAKALEALEETKRLWLEASLEHGHTIPEPGPSDTLVIEFRPRTGAQQA